MSNYPPCIKQQFSHHSHLAITKATPVFTTHFIYNPRGQQQGRPTQYIQEGKWTFVVMKEVTFLQKCFDYYNV